VHGTARLSPEPKFEQSKICDKSPRANEDPL
jgi:hypothetical protein